MSASHAGGHAYARASVRGVLLGLLISVCLVAPFAISAADPTEGHPTNPPAPTATPSETPTESPAAPTSAPTDAPVPTDAPTTSPTVEPTALATSEPADAPTPAPTRAGSVTYLVTFATTDAFIGRAALFAANGATETEVIAPLRMAAVDVPLAGAAAAAAALRGASGVSAVELGRERTIEATPDDTLFAEQWALPRIGWTDVYGSAAPSGSAIVAILDTGIDGSHRDLAGLLVPGATFAGDAPSDTDANGHGTAMAGIVAARVNNATGVAGVAFAGVRFMPVTVLGVDGTGADADIIAGLAWAVDHGADVVLMSFSSPSYSPALQAALDYAWSHDVVLVAATGNDGVSTVTYPAGDRGVIGVSNTDENDALNSSSNYGTDTFLGAPGTSITTTSPDGSYTSITGTSASAAMVAGAAALVRAFDPAATNGQVVYRLAISADDVASVDEIGNGRLDLYGAVASTASDFVQPTGAGVFGDGGPIVEPYVAAACVWNGGTSTAWENAANWTGCVGAGGLPGATDSASIGSTTFAPTISASTGTAIVKDLTVAVAVTVTQTGGTLEIWHDWKNSGTFNGTGGTVQFRASGGGGGTFATGTNLFFNVVVDSGVDPKFTADAGSALSIAGDFTNNNSALPVSANTTFTFNGAGAQSIYSAKTGTAATFGHLTINKSAGTVTWTSNANVAGTFAIDSGTVDLATFTANRATNGDGLTMGANTLLRVGGASGPTGYTVSSLNSTSTVEYYGTGTQTVTFASAISYNTLVVNKPSGTLSMSASGTVANLTFQQGVLGTGANTLTVSGTVSGAGASTGHVNGNLQRPVATSPVTFDVGGSSVGQHTSITLTGLSGTGSLTATTTGSAPASIANSAIDSTKKANRTWTLSSTGTVSGSYSVDVTYLSADLDAGATQSTFVVNRLSGTWTAGTSSSNASNTTTTNGLSAATFGDFAVGSEKAPDKVVFTTQPSNVDTGVSISPAVVAEIYTSNDFRATQSSAQINIGIGTNPGGGSLSGTTSANASNGLATFSDLSITAPGTGYTLTASSSGLTGATSSTFNVVPGTCTSTGSTAWNLTSTWTCARVPTSFDAVTIAAGHAVTIGSGVAAEAYSVTISTGGTSQSIALTATDASLTLAADLLLQQPTNGNNSQLIVDTGTVTVGGSLTMDTTATNSNRCIRVRITTGTLDVNGAFVMDNAVTTNGCGSGGGFGTPPAHTSIDMSGGAGTLSVAGALTITSPSTVTAGLSSHATSNLNFDGTAAQTIPMPSSTAWTYSNIGVYNTNVSGATLGAAISATKVTGSVTVYSGAKFDNGGFAIVGAAAKTFEVQDGASFRLGGTSAWPTGFSTFTLGGGSNTSAVEYYGGAQNIAATATIGSNYDNLTLSGSTVTKTLLGNITADKLLTVNSTVTLSLANLNATVGSLTGAGTVQFGSGAVANTFTVGSDSTSTSYTGVFNSTSDATDVFVKNGSGTLTVSNTHTFTGTYKASAGTLLLTGTLAASSTTTIDGGVLAGTGTAGIIGASANGGSLGPGNPASSTGTFSTRNFAFAAQSTYNVHLNGTTAGSGYDQTSVTGTVNLAGASLSGTVGFTPVGGDTFTIINNDGADAVTGTFSGLAEGAEVSLSGITFAISYVGGTGNDVVLTKGTALSGNVFEDVNYGGGAGRTKAASSGTGRGSARVELYTSAGVYSGFTTTDSNGNYTFGAVAPGTYYIRVVNSSITSSRSGYTSSALAVMTYRTDATSGSAVSVADYVGGTNPAVADPGDGSAGATFNTTTFVYTAVLTGTAQSVTKVVASTTDVTGLDFGFNFDTIVNVNDSGQGSLRAFITNANLLANAGLAQLGRTAGIDNAIFMISNGTAAAGLRAANNYFSGGVATITPASALPTIAEPIILDAQTQPGWTTVPIVQLTGTSAGVGAKGLYITAGASTVRGFIINAFTGSSASAAIWIATNGGNTIQGNYLGTNAAGSAPSANYQGVMVSNTTSNTIGGTSATTRNVISGNTWRGIFLDGGASSNGVRGNYIGLDATGTTAVANNIGIAIWSSPSNTIGGTGLGDGNIISGNTQIGIYVVFSASSSNTIQGNTIGRNAAGTAAVPNGTQGIEICCSGNAGSNNTIGGTVNGASNVISGNSGVGVRVSGGTGNAIQTNAIYGNGGIGIDLGSDGVTNNNGTKNGTLPNSEMDFPVFTSAVIEGTTLYVVGYVGSAPSQSLFASSRVEVFKADTDGGGNGEGRTYLGYVTADASGNLNGTITGVTGLAVGDSITGTATDTSSSTSEFGVNVVVAATAYVSASTWATSANASRYIAVGFPAYLPTDATVFGATFNHSYRSYQASGTSCYYIEVYEGASLIGTHGSAGSPISCQSGSAYVTDVISLSEVNTAARANTLSVRLIVWNSAGARSEHKLAEISVDYQLN